MPKACIPVSWRHHANFDVQPLALTVVAPMNSSSDPLPIEIDCRAVKQKLDSEDDFLLLDCRETDEHQTVAITGATLLPMTELNQRVDELEPHRERLIVVHCHHGGRSLRIAHWLLQQGFAQVQSLAGGIDQWAVEIDPSLPRY